MNERTGAILVAAGASRRMGFDKLWSELGGRLLVSYALETLAASSRIHQVAFVVSGERLADGLRLSGAMVGRVVVSAGGQRRRDSVALGLHKLGNCDWVLVHDAARPFLTEELICRGLDSARSSGVAVAALPATDTIKRVAEARVLETLPRDQLWAVQTPQVFRTELLRAALRSSDVDATDEAALVEAMGCEVSIFRGSVANWKITTAFDLELAEAWLIRGREGAVDSDRASGDCGVAITQSVAADGAGAC